MCEPLYLNKTFCAEKIQRQIADETKANPSAEHEPSCQNQANMLRRKILAWIDIQHLYIPGLHSYRQVDDVQEIPIEEVELYLPSSILMWV